MKTNFFLIIALLWPLTTCHASDIRTTVSLTDGEKTVYFKAVQMGCSGCVSKIESNISKAEGVKNVKADLASKSVIVVYDESKTDIEKLKADFMKFQYTVQAYYPDDANIKYVSFDAQQMKCSGCVAKVQKNISAEPGVKDLTVNLETKAVSVAYDSKVTSVDKLIDAFKKFDYNVTEIYNREKIAAENAAKEIASKK